MASEADCYDVVVAGAGPAGLTTAMMSARRGLHTMILAGEGVGGALLSISKIEDFPGFPEGVSGFELCPMVEEQVAVSGAEIRNDSLVGLTRSEDDWEVISTSGPLRTRAVVLAMGTRPRALGVPGEDRLVGSGISTCASCDGPFFREQPVFVVGSGDSGLSEALELHELGAQVTVVERAAAVSGQSVFADRVRAEPAITLMLDTEVIGVEGETRLEAVLVRKLPEGTEERLPAAAVFVCTGREPNTELLGDGIRLDDEGKILTATDLMTDLSGVFAVGDVRAGSAGQAAAAVGDGSSAAAEIDRYLRRNMPPTDATSHA